MLTRTGMSQERTDLVTGEFVSRSVFYTATYGKVTQILHGVVLAADVPPNPTNPQVVAAADAKVGPLYAAFLASINDFTPLVPLDDTQVRAIPVPAEVLVP